MKRLITALLVVFALFTIVPAYGQTTLEPQVNLVTTSTSGEFAVISKTFSHIVNSGLSNTLLLVFTAQGNGVATSVTFGGANLIKAIDFRGLVSMDLSAWYLINPPIGTFDVVITLDRIATIRAAAVTVTGADQTNPIDVTNSGECGSCISRTLTQTTVANNVLLFASGGSGSGSTLTAGIGQTIQWYIPSPMSLPEFTGSTKVVSAPTSISMSYSIPSSSAIGMLAVGIKPSVVPIVPEGNLWQKRSFEGKGFITTTNEITVTPAAETNFVLIRNPAASGKLHRVNELVVTVRTEVQNVRLRIYKNPTVTADGNPLAVRNVRTSGNMPVSQVFSLPTTSAPGQLMAAYSRNADSLDRSFDLSLYLEQGESYLITVQGTATGNDYILTYTFVEE